MAARLKTYSAASGFVYQYVFVGECEHAHATEYMFEVGPHHLSVLLAHTAIAALESEYDRELHATERYALAQMALRAAFDERAPDTLHASPVEPDKAALSRILDELDL